MSLIRAVFSIVGGAQYQAAVQNPEKAFKDPELQRGVIERRNTLPHPRSGGFAMVYRMSSRDTDGRRERLLAIRCFKNLPEDLAERYRAICSEVTTLASRSDLFVTTRFISDGIRIGSGWKPITTMPWVDGVFLDSYLDDSHLKAPAMSSLAERIRRLGDDLHRHGVAHGDLHRGNILVTGTADDPRLKLIDYDAMYVPGLRGRHSNEGGHPDYQHPGRRAEHFNANLDRFSLIVMLLSIHAVRLHPELWDPSNRAGEALLTGQGDYVDPEGSTVLAQLEKYDDLGPAVRLFRAICHGPIESVPSHREFLETLLPQAGHEVQGTGAPPKKVPNQATPPATTIAEKPAVQGPTSSQPSLPPSVKRAGQSRSVHGAEFVPKVAAVRHLLERSVGDRVEVVGEYTRFRKGDDQDTPYRTLVIGTGQVESLEVRVDKSVAAYFASMGRRWVVHPGTRISATGLLLRDGPTFYIDLEHPAMLSRLGPMSRAGSRPTPAHRIDKGETPRRKDERSRANVARQESSARIDGRQLLGDLPAWADILNVIKRNEEEHRG